MLETWNQRYLRGEHADRGPLAVIQRVVRDYPPGAALDLACGLGRHALYLAAHGWSVTALDSSDVAIARLRGSPQIEARMQDLTAPDFKIEPGAYDLICDCLYLQYPLIPQIRTGVRPGGLVAIALPMIDNSAGLKPMNPNFLVQPGELRSWFADWSIIDYREEPESPGCRSMAQLIARRCGNIDFHAPGSRFPPSSGS